MVENGRKMIVLFQSEVEGSLFEAACGPFVQIRE
jgi:hypothetical protein